MKFNYWVEDKYNPYFLELLGFFMETGGVAFTVTELRESDKITLKSRGSILKYIRLLQKNLLVVSEHHGYYKLQRGKELNSIIEENNTPFKEKIILIEEKEIINPTSKKIRIAYQNKEDENGKGN